jgi:hypothetical protein
MAGRIFAGDLGRGFFELLAFFLVVVDCEHVVVLDAVAEEEDGQFGTEEGRCLELLEGGDVVDETAAEGLVELGVGLVLAEVEDVVDVVESLLKAGKLHEVGEGEGGLVVELELLL